jgi:hypothetical protein
VILMLASAQDVHARHVLAALQRRNAPAELADCGEFGNGARLNYPIGGSPTITTGSGKRIDFGAVTSVWYRRPRLAQTSKVVRDPATRRFCREEWANTLDGMFLNSPARFVNPLLAEFAAVKPRQLHVAARVGLLTPDTIITSDPAAADEFIARHAGHVIHKALTAPPERLLDTRAWSETDRPALPHLALAPTIFQETISGPADIRATVIGDEVFAARIDTAASRAGIDSRMDLDAKFERHQLPAALLDQIRAFMREMQLVYGTIDLKVRDDGEYVFLEVNPQGQFLYVEILTGQPLTDALAALLAKSV